MKIEIQLAQTVLQKVFAEKEIFQRALKSVFPHNDPNRQYLGTVSSLVGSELRHHLLFAKLVDSYIDEGAEISFDDKLLIYIALANHHFVKRLASEELVKDLQALNLPINFVKLFSNEKTIYELLSEIVTNIRSLEYISIRFNTPTWLVKMWQKHFGYSATFKILKRNARPPKTTVRVNTLVTSEEKILSSNAEFFSKTTVANLLEYNGKTPLRQNEFFRSFDVFNERQALKKALDEVFAQVSPNQFFIYSSKDDASCIEAMLLANRKIGVNLGVPKKETRPELARLIRIYKLKNVNYFEAPTDQMLAAVTQKQQLVILNPKSSSFDEIRIYPDFLLHFEKEKLDELIANQKKMLYDVSNFVDEEGKLVYIVNTLDRKESHSLINLFLNEHREFKLIQEKQYLPYDADDCALYIAIMQRTGIASA